MPGFENFISQTFRAPNPAEVDRARYSNALAKNQVARIPQANKAQDLAIQGDEQALNQNRQGAARKFVSEGFSALAQSQDPIKFGQTMLANPSFQAAMKDAGLDVSQFTIDPAKGDTAETISRSAMDHARMLGSPLGGGDGFTLSPGQTRFGANGRQVASVAAPADQGGYALSPGQTRFDSNNRQVANVPASPPNQPPGQGFDQAAKLRAEFNTQTATFRAASDGYRSVLAASKNPSAAGDIALIFSFMRTLDPNSTVREGEFATAQNAGGVPDKVRAQYNKIINGERLSADQRTDFVSQATQLYNGHRQGYDSIAARYTDLATRAGISPQDVIGLSTGVDTGGGGPRVGTVEDGYRFKGGDPAQPTSWERIG